MMLGSYRTFYGGQPRLHQTPAGHEYRTTPWLLQPGLSKQHMLKMVPEKPAGAALPTRQWPSRSPPPPPQARSQRIAAAGQASGGTDPSPWVVLGVIAVGIVGYEALKYSIKQYGR